jgi:N-acetylglucosaminyldiphosphoundecaprenol N-acetyl-beta-D-mannosaminyltransferase
MLIRGIKMDRRIAYLPSPFRDIKRCTISSYGDSGEFHFHQPRNTGMAVAFLPDRSSTTGDATMAIELLEAPSNQTPSNNVRTAPAALPRIRLFDIAIDNVTLDHAVETIVERLDGETATQVSFVNADCVNVAYRNREYKKALQQSDLVFADGIGVRVAGDVLGQPVRDNVNGTDLFPLLAKAIEHTGKRIYLLGGQPGVAEGVAEWLADNYPGVEIAGFHHGYFTTDKEAEVIEEIRASGADLVLVAFGAPRQELWIKRNLGKLGAKVVIGVGGLLDFFSGRIARAPRWVRRLGMEWAYRMLQEPKRLWRRYLIGNVVFLARLAQVRLAGNVRSHG